MKFLFTKTLGAQGWLKYWSLFILMFPYYIFKPGLPQPSDLILFVTMFIYLNKRGLYMSKRFLGHLNNFKNLVAYIFAVNTILFIVRIGMKDKDPSLITNLFYTFNIIVFAFSFSLFDTYKKEFVYTTVYSVLLSGIIQILLSPWGHMSEGRETLFFDNPNQLGYYAICCLSIILAFERYLKLSRVIIFLSFGVFFYFTMLCVSKAAIGSMLLLMIVYLASNKLLSVKMIFTSMMVFIGVLVVLFKTPTGEKFVRNLSYRLEYSVKPNDVSEWEYRGYDRMNNHPYYMILGAGEGAYNRFTTYIDNHEMHSSLGTILFCYGIPGSILFSIFILSLLSGLPRTYSLYILPVIAYGLVHMGLRFTIFYIALAMFPVVRELLQEEEEEAEESEMEEVNKLSERKGIKPLWLIKEEAENAIKNRQ